MGHKHMPPGDRYREFCRRDHRIIGHFLAVQSWLRGLDCIVLVRGDLEAFFGIKRFESTRIKWLEEDLKPWFPSQTAYYRTKAPSSIHSLFLSRVPMDKYLPNRSMTTEERVERAAAHAPPIERLTTKQDGSEVPSLAKIVSSLSVFAAGLEAPKKLRKRESRKREPLPV
jgi:hypothetical protein